mmetsp:Transcript_28558/g.53975  ORF Transcript_28558/g.53975 Transcript_28558/m.53975 type:complete len:103 (-) Transcript_28558:124-432(-)
MGKYLCVYNGILVTTLIRQQQVFENLFFPLQLSSQYIPHLLYKWHCVVCLSHIHILPNIDITSLSLSLKAPPPNVSEFQYPSPQNPNLSPRHPPKHTFQTLP